MSHYRNQLETYLKALSIKAERVADVGGGAYPVDKRVKEWNVQTYHIFDSGLEEQKKPPDFVIDMNTYLKEEYKPYDLVFCLELMEYIYDPHQAIVNLSYLTGIEGKLIISFPFVYPQHNPIDADFLRYTPVGAEQLLKLNGFHIQRIIYRRAKNDLLEKFYKSDGMHIAANPDMTGFILEAIRV